MTNTSSSSYIHSILELRRKYFAGYSSRMLCQHLVFFLTLISFFTLWITPKDFKIYFLVSFLLWVIIYSITRKLLLSLLIVLFSTAPFISPGKYYSFSLIQPGEVRWEAYRETGMIEAYGLVVSDIFTVVISYLALRNYFALQNKKGASFKLLLEPKGIASTLVSWSIYALVLLYSSSAISGFPIFSVVTALQYCKLILIFIALWAWFAQEKRAKEYFVQILLGTLFFSSGIALLQIVGSSSAIALPQANQPIEEAYLFPRPVGIFTHSNQLGFQTYITLLMIGSMYSLGAVHKKLIRLYYIGFVLGAVVILFSQSRSVWLIAGLTTIAYFLSEGKAVIRAYRDILLKYRHVLLLFFLIITVVLIAPRVYYTQFSFQQGSGSIRKRMIEEGSFALRDSPLFGFGANTNVIVMLRYFPKGYIQDFPFGVHLGYLQIALEAGVIGAISFFFPWLNILRHTNGITLSIKKFFFRSSIFLVFMYYIFQPHSGRIDFFYLGVLMVVCLVLINVKRNSYES